MDYYNSYYKVSLFIDEYNWGLQGTQNEWIAVSQIVKYG